MTDAPRCVGHFKFLSTFFKKGVDKPFCLCYNACVIQRQQVPVKVTFA